MMFKKKRNRSGFNFFEALKLDLFFEGFIAIFKVIFKVIGSMFD